MISNSGHYRPRVALNCLAGFAPTNGARVYLLELAQALADKEDIELVLITAQGESSKLPSSLRALAHEIDVPPGRSFLQILRAPRIAKALRAANVALWHVPNTLPLFWGRTPTVITIHDVLDLKI